jgi:hypothetical protein
MHLIGPPAIRMQGAARETTQCYTYCVAHHIGADTEMILGLRYVGRFERRGRGWLIAKRVCAFDWTYMVPFDPANRFVFEDTATVGRLATGPTSPTAASG